MASVGALRLRLRRRLTWALGLSQMRISALWFLLTFLLGTLAHRNEEQRAACCPSGCNLGSTIVAVVCRHELQFHPVSVWFQASSMASSNRHYFWCPDGPCYRRGANVPPPRGRWRQGAIAEQQPSVIRNVVVTCAPALLGTWSTNAKQLAERTRQYDLTGKEARQWQAPTISK
jgi:hypothetical protein